MTRALLVTAVCGLVACIVCFTVAFSMGGFPWRNWAAYGWVSDGEYGHHGPIVDGGGPTITREIPWDSDGPDELVVVAPAEVTYTQGSPARMVITGPKGSVDSIEVHDGRIRFNRRVRSAETVQIALTAPNVDTFNVAGSQALHILNFDHDSLEVKVAGSASVDAKGRANEVELVIAGSGDADFAGLATDKAEVTIAGSGRATIGPRREAEVKIAGSGDLTLTSDPPVLDTKIFGSGKIVRAAPPAKTEPAPAAAPQGKKAA